MTHASIDSSPSRNPRLAAVHTLGRYPYVVLSMEAPGRRPVQVAVLVWSESGEWALRVRRDLHLVTDDEDLLGVMVALESQLEADLRALGPDRLVALFQSDWSGVCGVSDTREAMGADPRSTANRLYREQIDAHVQRYETHLPRIHLAAAAGSWGEAMSPERSAAEAEDWVEILDDRPLDERMFVAQVVGRSMEPEIPDGSWCIFRAHPGGSRDGRMVLVENNADATQRYTVKRYRSVKTYDAEGAVTGRRVRLEPLNPEFSPWELDEDSECRILAEFVAVVDI